MTHKIFKNTKANHSGAHPQHGALKDLYGKEVRVLDLTGLGSVTISGILRGGKSPYDQWVIIVNDEIMYSFYHFDVGEIDYETHDEKWDIIIGEQK